MAGKAKKRVRARKKRHSAAFWIALALLLALAALFAYMRAAAALVHVRRTEVYLRDLPATFDGVTILYISDPDILSDSSLRRAQALLDSLQALKPDVLLLGGDYASEPLLSRLNRGVDSPSPDADILDRASRFVASLADFSAPMGKYAVLSRDDPSASSLEDAMAAGGVTLLQNALAPITNGGGRLIIAGLNSSGEAASQLSRVSRLISGGDCVVAFAHSVSTLPAIQVSEARDGGGWVDLALFGGTHGGQIRLGSHTALQLTGREAQYPRGWYAENGAKFLVSQGLGCESVSLRLGTRAEVHLLTLRRGEAPDAN